jgi:hypothetical protein
VLIYCRLSRNSNQLADCACSSGMPAGGTMAARKKKTLTNALVAGCLVGAVAGPLVTYVQWDRTNFLRKLHSEGVTAKAHIDSGTVKRRVDGSAAYYFDLSWTDQRGSVYKKTGAGLSSSYAQKFVSRQLEGDTFVAKELPIKYLAASPSQFVLVDDPANSDKDRDLDTLIGLIVSAISLTGVLFYYVPRYFGRRREAETA